MRKLGHINIVNIRLKPCQKAVGFLEPNFETGLKVKEETETAINIRIAKIRSIQYFLFIIPFLMKGFFLNKKCYFFNLISNPQIILSLLCNLPKWVAGIHYAVRICLKEVSLIMFGFTLTKLFLGLTWKKEITYFNSAPKPT